MRLCRRCRERKPLEAFDRKSTAADGVNRRCRDCINERKRELRVNKDTYRTRDRAWRRNREQDRLRHVNEYLLNHPCVDCGEGDLLVLEFDHVRGIKRANVKTLARQTVSIKSIDAEIAKCEVRCANCHRRKTIRDKDWMNRYGGKSAARYKLGTALGI